MTVSAAAGIVSPMPGNTTQVQVSPEMFQQLQALPPQQQQLALSQLAAQQANLGAEALKPPNKIATILKNVVIFGGIGAALGFGGSMLGLPFIGGFAAPIAAAIGGGVGAVIGLVRGLASASSQQKAYEAAVAAQTPAPAPPVEPGPATPDAAPAPKSAPGATKRKKYSVRSGDTLSSIAARHKIGWQKLYAANKAVVGANPNLIRPGQKLVIPGA